MLTIIGSAALAQALDSPIDPDLKRLLALRREQLAEYGDDHIHFLLVGTDDARDAIEEVAGVSLAEPPFEWIADHAGRWFEAPIIFSDDGAGIVLFVPNDDGVDPALLMLLREQAVPSNELTTNTP